MISSSFDRPERTASTASDARNRYKMRITTARMDASHLVNTYAQVSGTHRADNEGTTPLALSHPRPRIGVPVDIEV